MTTKDVSHSPSVPYEEGLYSRLQDPKYVGYFLAAAVQDLEDDPDSVFSALSHIIYAHAPKDPDVAFACISLVIHSLDGNSLHKLTDLLETNMPKKHQARYKIDVIPSLHKMADLLLQGAKIELEGVSGQIGSFSNILGGFQGLSVNSSIEPQNTVELKKAFKEYALAC